ncbi:MAG TPA: alkaline phosphatase family protein, partial [Vicinamibacteria bacterium]|nr:alkaline phosphatase family protein [Vicinamibacteria bacterium]
PFVFTPPPQERTEPLSQRALLVLMDGLGLEASRSMPFLNELRARGASLDCQAGLPSLSMPARAVLMTGAWQEIHGQTTNYGARPLTVEHLFQLVRAGGGETALAAGDKTQALFAPYVTRQALFDEPPETAPFEHYQAVLRRDLAASLDLLRTRPRLAQVELNLVDEAGHGWGSGSPEYARAAALVDDGLRAVAAAVDLERDTLLVTADHGHVPAGGHGGPEPDVMGVPLVLAGAGVRRGATGACAQVDVAPTLAVLLGLPLPAASQGRPLLDALALDGEARRRVLRNVVAQRHAFVTAYVARVAALSETAAPGDPAEAVAGGRAAAGDIEASEGALQARAGAIAAREAGARARFAQSEARRRWLRAGLAALLPLALLGALVRFRVATRGEVGNAAAFALGGVALYHVLLPAFGLSYSLTAVNKDEWLEPFFMKDMALGAGVCAAAALALCVRARRRGAGP